MERKLSLSSWAKGKAWADALPTNVSTIREFYRSDGLLYITAEVRNSRGLFQTAWAIISVDGRALHADGGAEMCDGGTVIDEDGSQVAKPYTYHVAALIRAWKTRREQLARVSYRQIMARGYVGD